MAADLSSSPAKITSNYSKSIEEVYTDVVRFSLSQKEHGLQVLGHVFHLASYASNSQSFNSWVPDYRLPGLEPFLAFLADSAWAYTACGAKKTHNVTIEGPHLVTQGLHVDEILGVTENLDHLDLSRGEGEALASADDIYCHTGQTIGEVFRTTVVADMNARTRSRGYTADWSLLYADTHTLTTGENARRDNMVYAEGLACNGRRLCETKAGLIGLVPPSAQPGDHIAVLWGGQMMHVLRRKDNGTFFYVGDSYIHGVMDGELVTNDVGDGETIVLE
ncbi:MAG: hypothetical protein Q9168_004484 [Polycauliona sp. 1 TL-2023]